MKFAKMHGCGNDYIIINCLKEIVDEPEKLALQLSDRHFGIGADGLVLIDRSELADYKMKIFNADGSPAEMCGNAIRCIGKYMYENRLTNKTTITVETLAGIKTLFLTVFANQVIDIMVDMGTPITTPGKIPVCAEKNIVVDEPITILGEEFLMTCISMGNPYAIVFTPYVDSIKLGQIGLPFEYNVRFPNRTNIGFVQILDENNIKMRIWERGAGETLACGTGACAAVMAGILKECLANDVYVHLPGGNLKVRYDRKDRLMYLSGPTELVYEGEIMI